MKQNCFLPANILLPKVEDMSKWAVIACDQFSSQPEYWDDVREITKDSISTMNLILPEAELGSQKEAAHTKLINETMAKYMADGSFTTYENSFIYVERTLLNGDVRKGLVGMADLDAYDYSGDSSSDIRATEKTVVSRIPPRMRVRENAPAEFPHVLMLADDHQCVLIEPITLKRDSLTKVYDCDLMKNGGHITGWLVNGAEADAFNERLAQYSTTVASKYEGLVGNSMVFAVGDGNHSLATAKSCYEALKKQNPDTDLSAHPARYALVELGNIHDSAQSFEPIHRVLLDVDSKALLQAIREEIGAETGFPLIWHIGEESGTIYLDEKKGQLGVAVLQPFLDAYLEANKGEIDYIHGEEPVINMAKGENVLGLLLPLMKKSELFRGVVADDTLPRKTFSMGHAEEKRYYLEGRKIIK